MSEAVPKFCHSQQNNSETETLRQAMVAFSYAFAVHILDIYFIGTLLSKNYKTWILVGTSGETGTVQGTEICDCCFLLTDVYCACERTRVIFSSTGWPDFKEKLLTNRMNN
jgi:uncharacterized membrane protein (DUF485 family)